MMNKLRLAILMTCYNRKEKTISCLQRLYEQELPLEVQFQVYLVNDGSTDGTEEAVQKNYPTVKLIQGDGNLFWNGGMRLAFTEAMKSDYDYYLWLNDDTLLYPNALITLLNTDFNLAKQGHNKIVIAGSILEPKTNVLSYGGCVKQKWWHPLKFRLLEPTEKPQTCLTINGNCVLIPKETVKLVGNLDSGFTHSIGDVDYGLRVRQKAGSVWISPGYIGTCEHNITGLQAWNDPNISLKQRWQKVNHVKGLPMNEWQIFTRRHGGLLWGIFWVLPYIRLLLKSFFANLKMGQV